MARHRLDRHRDGVPPGPAGGYPDLYVTGEDKLYHNAGDGTFSAGPAVSADDRAAHWGDNDGDLDLAVTQADSTNTLLRNDLDDDGYLKVRVLGAGRGRTNKAAMGTRVDLHDSSATTLLARRDVGIARGFGGTEPMWVHFGGVTNTDTYVVRVHFRTGVVDTTVVPQSGSTTIGSTTINQMLTIEEEGAPRIITRTEVDPN